jgi:non-specific serine/threonine protein kinase
MTNTAPALFGALLLRFRVAAGLTQEQLAARAGLSPDTISALESGKRRAPRFATVELLATALGLAAPDRHQLVIAAREPGGTAGAGETRAPKRARQMPGAEQSAEQDGRRQSWWTVAGPSPLVGRAQELETIVRSLTIEGVRLLTLVGPAGVGKTRLVLVAAHRAAECPDHFSDGVVFVDLTPVRDPALVLGVLARALGLLDIGGRPILDRLEDMLAERRQLMVLDNFEQVLPAAAQLADLLSTCPGLVLLVTSRVPLGLRWEQTLRIAPLPVPDPNTPLPPLDELLAVPAVALFIGRARARRADFALTGARAPLLAEVVVALDGLPLALELAAARLDVLSLPTLARRLGDRLQLLASEAPDRPARQRSLEAAIGWSYDLLSELERRLFRCLGVFVGRVSLDAVSAVAGAIGSDAAVREVGDAGRTLPRLVSLAEKSLLLPARPDEERGAEEEDPEPAFAMLETVREYAREQLATAGELASAQRAHAHYFLALAERADLQLRERDQRAWFFRLEREHDNLRAALRWLLDQDDSAERKAALRLAGALGWFWLMRGSHAEGCRWLEEALARTSQHVEAEGADPAVRTRALVAAGRLLAELGEDARAQAVLEEALALAERRHDLTDIAQACIGLGFRAVVAGEMVEGTRQLHEALRGWEALRDPRGVGETLFYLGLATDNTRGDLATAPARYTAAAAHYVAALERLEAAGDAQLAGFVHCCLGMLAWKRGDLPYAIEQVQAGLETSVTFRNLFLLSFGAQAAAMLVGGRAKPAARVRLLGATDALKQATGATLAWERLPAGQDVVGLREQLAREGEWDAAYREGRSLPFGEVAALALGLLEEIALAQALPQPDTGAAPAGARPPERPSQPSEQNRSPLTAREQEVLRLVAQGRSNKAIGKQLFLSPSTVNHHLTAIFTKLGVNTRAQAVAEAAQRGHL